MFTRQLAGRLMW